MEAGTLNCPMCGAASRTDATNCSHCDARLATVACGSCFGMLFAGSKYCPHCGVLASRAEHGALDLSCPHCREPMGHVTAGKTTLSECSRCSGLWVDVEAFEKICSDHERHAAVLGMPSVYAQPGAVTGDKVRYIPCPVCRGLMNRVNFANCSGVIVDVCSKHGTWFDRDELRRIVEFIRRGGIDESRRRTRLVLQEEERKLRRAAAVSSLQSRASSRSDITLDEAVTVAADALFNFFIH